MIAFQYIITNEFPLVYIIFNMDGTRYNTLTSSKSIAGCTCERNLYKLIQSKPKFICNDLFQFISQKKVKKLNKLKINVTNIKVS